MSLATEAHNTKNTRYTAGERIKAVSSTATGTVTAASRTTVSWAWDHNTAETWTGTPKELAEIATVTAAAPSRMVQHVRRILGL